MSKVTRKSKLNMSPTFRLRDDRRALDSAGGFAPFEAERLRSHSATWSSCLTTDFLRKSSLIDLGQMERTRMI